MGKATRYLYVRAFHFFFVPLLPLLGLLPMGPASKQPSSTIEIILVLSLDLDPRGPSLLFSSAVLFVSLFYPLPQPPSSYRPLLLFFSFPRLQLV
ncbi:hypothetical protein CSPX01_16045 [Colletotrichum filicis]|nr:hypothetical protein CSPX01_16045 [Colletotrichum filicis]